MTWLSEEEGLYPDESSEDSTLMERYEKLVRKFAQLEAFKILVEAAVSVKKQGGTLGKQWYEEAEQALEAGGE